MEGNALPELAPERASRSRSSSSLRKSRLRISSLVPWPVSLEESKWDLFHCTGYTHTHTHSPVFQFRVSRQIATRVLFAQCAQVLFTATGSTTSRIESWTRCCGHFLYIFYLINANAITNLRKTFKLYVKLLACFVAHQLLARDVNNNYRCFYDIDTLRDVLSAHIMCSSFLVFSAVAESKIYVYCKV